MPVPATAGDDVQLSTTAVGWRQLPAVQSWSVIAKDRHDCSVGDVAGALQVVHSTASRLVERAVRTGMVYRGRSSSDPRRTVLSLTAAGRGLQRDAVDFRTERLDALVSDWPVADVITFTNLLERFARCAYPSTEDMS